MPSDLEPRADFERAVGEAAREVQAWYRERVARGFELADPCPELIRTSHEERWYSAWETPSDYSQWFWENAIADAAELAGARFDDPQHCWVLYVHAEPGPRQAIGGASGICLLPHHDLLGLVGESGFLGERATSRWVGGLAHELGHAVGLPHPPPCERDPGHADCQGLMYHGFRQWPDTFLLPAEVEQLRRSRFFR
ncbi:MAG TPA: hypothetical protein VF134_08865 [Candidatus Dormibacteraeota bacterium]